jgi:hypothetical protein
MILYRVGFWKRLLFNPLGLKFIFYGIFSKEAADNRFSGGEALGHRLPLCEGGWGDLVLMEVRRPA